MVCTDENVYLYFPKLFYLLADHMQNATLYAIATNCYPVCTTSTKKIGEYSNTGYHSCCHTDYAIAYDRSEGGSLTAHGMKDIKNALWSIPNLNPPELVRADILHNVLVGIFDYLIDWIQSFLEYLERINAINYVWWRLPPHFVFLVPTKEYRVV